jgi:hypothetical protein
MDHSTNLSKPKTNRKMGPRRSRSAHVWFLDDEWERVLQAVGASELSRREFMRRAVIAAADDALGND